MGSTVTSIMEQVRTLPAEEKLDLMRALIADLDGTDEANVEQAWVAEARRRRLELEQGESQAVSGDTVFREARARLGR